METTIIAPKKDEGTLSKRNGFELIEVSPVVFKLAERLREMNKGNNTLEFYRSVIRIGLQRKVMDLFRAADKSFLKATTRMPIGSESYNSRARIRETTLQELDSIKSDVEAL